MNTKNNQRFLDTEKNLEQTFLTLCQNTQPEKITVSRLCNEVQINRSTFYDHYLDIPDLIHKTGAKHMGNMANLLRQSKKTPIASLIPLLSYIKENQDFFDIYFNHSSQSALNISFFPLLESACEPYLKSFGIQDKERLKYHFTFFSAGFVAILGRWVQSGCKEKPEEIADILLKNLPV